MAAISSAKPPVAASCDGVMASVAPTWFPCRARSLSTSNNNRYGFDSLSVGTLPIRTVKTRAAKLSLGVVEGVCPRRGHAPRRAALRRKTTVESEKASEADRQPQLLNSVIITGARPASVKSHPV